MMSEGENHGKVDHFHLILNRQMLVNLVQCQMFDLKKKKKKIGSDFFVKLLLLDVSNSSKNVWEVHKHDCMLQIAPELPVCILFTFYFCHLCVCGVFVFAFCFVLFFIFKKHFRISVTERLL